jgi:cell division protein FtsB
VSLAVRTFPPDAARLVPMTYVEEVLPQVAELGIDEIIITQLNELRSIVQVMQREVLPQMGEIRGAFSSWNADHREYKHDFAEAMRQFITIREELGLIRDAVNKTAIDVEVMSQKLRAHDEDIVDLKATNRALQIVIEKMNDKYTDVTDKLEERVALIEKARAREGGERRVMMVFGGSALSAIGVGIGALLTYIVPLAVSHVASWFSGRTS